MCYIRVLDVITWLIVAFGWVAFHWLASRRDKANHLLSKIDGAIARIEEIEESAMRYWRSPGSSEPEQDLQRSVMILKIDHLERTISDLSRKARNTSYDEEINDLLKSILDDDGESVTRSALQPDDPRLTRIATAARRLTSKLQSM